MNKRYDVPETSVSLRRITKDGDDADMQDCVAGIEIADHGVLRLDLRNLRPIRLNDRDNLIVEIYLHDVLTALADRVESVVTE